MSFNSSVSTNSSYHPDCLNNRDAFLSFFAFVITNILLLLPLCCLIIYLGLKRWQKQRSASTAASVSHSDLFTYHMAALEMIGVVGCAFLGLGSFCNVSWLMMVGMYSYSASSYGQMFLHIVTCVERYLAVVHPITYMGLKTRGGVRIRNITIGCLWLWVLGSVGLTAMSIYSPFPAFCLSLLCILVVSFCSLSVLCTLIRPGPGEGGRDKERVNQSKMRAFHTIMAIMGVLLLRFGGYLLVLAIYSSPAVSQQFRCVISVSAVWFNLPSSLVLPLLFLHRTGNLLCWKNSNQSGQESE